VTLRYTPLERPVAAAKKPPESPLEAAAHAAAIATAETPRSNGKAAKIDDGSPANSNQGTSPGSPERAHLLRLELTKLRERLARDAEEDKAAAAASESDKRSQKDAMSWSTSSKDGKESIEEEIAESSEPHTIPEMVSEAVPVPNGTKVQEWVAPRMAPRGLPRGASEGVDWSDLSKRVGNLGVVEGDAFELCCYVDHRPSSTQAAMWRDRRSRRIVVSFRGTSDVMDVLTDVNLLQTPFEQRPDGKPSDDPRLVHAGFFASARAVNRRLKELLVAACAGTPGEWEVGRTRRRSHAR